MLNNKKGFDILTPMTDFHRVTKHIKDTSNYIVEAGKWVAITNDGLETLDFGYELDGTIGTIPSSLYALALSSSTGITYESHDLQVGSTTVTRMPGIRVRIGSDLLIDPDDPTTDPLARVLPGTALKPVTIEDAKVWYGASTLTKEEAEATIGKLMFVYGASSTTPGTTDFNGVVNGMVEEVGSNYIIYEIAQLWIQG